MSKSFVDEGVPEILDRVGDGKLSGKLTIDQVYARYQHERLDLRHPRGGKARYLADPLMAGFRSYYERMARDLLQPEGLRNAMIDSMESLMNSSQMETPVELDNLRRSSRRVVRDQNAVVSVKGPDQGRLSDEDLRMLRRGRRRYGDQSR